MVSEDILQKVRVAMRGLKAPGFGDRVYKDECMFTFDTPESPGGLYINLHTFQGYGEEYVLLDHQRTGRALYLHEKATRMPLSADELAADGAPSKLAVGGEGGFQVDKKKYKIERVRQLVLLPDFVRVPLPCPDLPELVNNVVAAIAAHDSASAQDAVAVWEEERRVSKYALELPQLPGTRKLSPNPKDWRCDETGVTENLWLNLSTGFVGSGRQNWDGSGGNGAALRHYEATGRKYPLCVKLGTITPHGADVFSYAEDENDMVLDPLLAAHLSHWGINMMAMEKTEKTMAELQIDLNMSFEFDKITEAGSALEPLSGPGYVGLTNLGNSCYMNSVLQVLCSVPEVAQRYAAAAPQIFASAPPEPASDLPTQLAKVALALTTGRTGAPVAPPLAGGAAGDAMQVDGGAPAALAGAAAPTEAPPAAEPCAVKPAAFKSLVGRGHAEFSSSRQQDAGEYFGHLLEAVARAERTAGERLGGQEQPITRQLFTFTTEDRVQCLESGRVSYKTTAAALLPLFIPMEAATNGAAVEEYKQREAKRQRLREAEAVAYIGAEGGAAGAGVVARDAAEEPVIPTVPFAACLERFGGSEVVDDYLSAALGRKTQATKTQRLATFPPYLLVQMSRYYQDSSDWSLKKLDVLVGVPERLSLGHLRGAGPQPGEQLQPAGEEPAAAGASAATPPPAAPEPDAAILAQLLSMGFPENGCKRACLAVGNSGTEAAMEWVFGHMEDADFDAPLPAPGTAAAAPPAAEPAVSAESVETLVSICAVSERQAKGALVACGGSVERACDWIFSRMDGSLDEEVEKALNPPAAGAATGGAAVTGGGANEAVLDGPGEYELLGIISHMGKNTMCGHYVCHVKKDGRWVIFNDEKVAASAHPPLDLGYLYLFKRVA